jgi:predicted metal-dependent hydrolase
MHQIDLGNINVDVVLKDIKNVHLSVQPPLGKVRIAAPNRMDLETIRMFAISKLGWIKKHQTKMIRQERESLKDYKTRESHYFLGKRYLLKVVEGNHKSSVMLNHSNIVLNVRKNASKEQRQVLLQEWYRTQLKEISLKMIRKWEKKMNVAVGDVRVRKMKTRWGSCNHKSKKIHLNLELAKKPLQCLEYIIVHEMVHLIERKHGERFLAYMNKFLPSWKVYKGELSRLPIASYFSN